MTREGLVAWLRRRLTPGEYFGLELSLGVGAFVAGAWCFGSLAEDVQTGDPITQLDARIAIWWAGHQDARVASAMSMVSWLHTWPIALVGLGFLAYLLWRRNWMWLIAGASAVAGGMALNTLLKLAFHRARPTLSGLAAAIGTYSFPSGHTLGATLLYAVFAAYAIGKVRSRATRICIGVAATLMVALVAFSRIYLGVHYLSDVLAAIAEGIAWFALCYAATATLIARWKRRRMTPR